MSTREQKERFHFLDGIRGIAAFMIVIHHSLTSAIAKGLNKTHIPYLGDLFSQTTQSGVELFFVLSGVVLLRPYLRGNRQFKTPDYLFRRLKRIYPPYFFALLFGAGVILFLGAFPTWYNKEAIHIQFTWLETLREAFIFNFMANYYNLAWWSLQLEVLFYLLVPIIILYYPRNKAITNRNVVVAVAVTLLIAMIFQLVFTSYFDFYYSYCYNANILGKFIEYPVCFLMGILLAARDFNVKEAKMLVLTGVLLIISGLIISMPIPQVLVAIKAVLPGYKFVDANSGSLFFMSVVHSGYGLFYAGIISLAFKVTTFKSILSKPLMVWMGERSYSLFLIHFSVFYFTDNIISRFTSGRNLAYGILTRACGISFAVFAAMLLFHFVERRQAKGLLTAKAFWPWQAKKVMEGEMGA